MWNDALAPNAIILQDLLSGMWLGGYKDLTGAQCVENFMTGYYWSVDIAVPPIRLSVILPSRDACELVTFH